MVLRTVLSLLVLSVTGAVVAQERSETSRPTADGSAAKPAGSVEVPVSSDAGRDSEKVAVPVVAPVPVKSVEATVPIQSSQAEISTGESGTPQAVAVPVVPSVQPRTTRKGYAMPELPAEFVSRDKNGDGQIGLYEWDRKKFAEFTKLDKNGDGFLTAVELLPKGVMKAFYSKTPARAGSPPGVPVAGSPATPGTPVAGVPVAVPDAVDQEARKTFGDMDENKDGAIDESDWGRSRRIRPWFEGVGIKVNLPMNIETFVGNYRRAKEGQSR
ncbi:MAG: hypothetical protein WCJ09_13535 [Planctomycetota bacterium]